MQLPRHSLFTICSITSLVLWIGTVFLWARSYWRSDEVFRTQDGPAGSQEYGISTYKGCFCFFRHYGPGGAAATDDWRFTIGKPAAPASIAGWGLNAWGFHYSTRPHYPPFYTHIRPDGTVDMPQLTPIPGSGTQIVGFAYWYPFLLTAVMPICLVFLVRGRWRRQKRRRLGLCQNCSYNLTGNVSGVCPECGEKLDATAVQPGSITTEASRTGC